MSDVFISYARSTERQAHAVAEALRALGLGVWRDDQLPANRAYAEVIEERLRSAKAVVVIWSSEAVKSQWVRAEADMAREAGTLVQASIDGSIPPLPFNQIQCAIMTGWEGDPNSAGWRKLVSGVRDLVEISRPTPARPSSPDLPLPAKPSIAVLPFTGGGPQGAGDDILEGMTEEITNALSRMPSLFVSVGGVRMSQGEAARDHKHIARELGVRYLLEGSVRRAPGRVRISVKLIDAGQGALIWTERFDETLEDVFALQDKVAISVAAVIDSALEAAEYLRVGGQPQPPTRTSVEAPPPPASAEEAEPAVHPMVLTLAVTNIERLDNGESTELVLDGEGAVIGRSAHADWTLPDPRNYISSTHCEVEYRDGCYWLTDHSTNGVFLNGDKERLSGPHCLSDGDDLVIGHYRIEARLTEKPADPVEAAAVPAVEDVWALLESSSRVDWGRSIDNQVGAPSSARGPAAGAGAEAGWASMLAAAGLDADEVGHPAKTGAAAGALLRHLVAGLVVMLEARARTKAQLGAEGTAFSPDGNNPLKFARTPHQALAQLVSPPKRGYMSADQAVNDAFKDLQAHQMATLAAMQDALRTTLERFSPRAIRERAESRDLLEKLIPGAREAALWKAYEREFEGVVIGSDEAFMATFAKAFREAYERSEERGW